MSFSANVDCGRDLIASTPASFNPLSVELIVAVRKACCISVHRLSRVIDPRAGQM